MELHDGTYSTVLTTHSPPHSCLPLNLTSYNHTQTIILQFPLIKLLGRLALLLLLLSGSAGNTRSSLCLQSSWEAAEVSG